MIKKCFICFSVIFCILFQNGGIIYLYTVIQKIIKDESCEIVANSNDIPEESISQIIISKNNPNPSIILENNEIETNGIKYDIISKTEDENNIYYKVYCDKKETDFIANASSRMKAAEKSHQHKRMPVQNISQLIGVLPEIKILSPLEQFEIFYSINTKVYYSFKPDLPTPPPKV